MLWLIGYSEWILISSLHVVASKNVWFWLWVCRIIYILSIDVVMTAIIIALTYFECVSAIVLDVFTMCLFSITFFCHHNFFDTKLAVLLFCVRYHLRLPSVENTANLFSVLISTHCGVYTWLRFVSQQTRGIIS